MLEKRGHYHPEKSPVSPEKRCADAKRCSIIAFSTEASVVLPMTQMLAGNQVYIDDADACGQPGIYR